MFHVKQSKLNTISDCPICGSKESTVFLKSKDHGHSQEDFSINECNSCGFRFTSPIPTEEEIGRYYNSEDYISHTDSNRGVVNKVYKRVRNYSIKKKFQLTNSLTTDKTLLDIGCGTGDFLSYVKDQNWTVKGLEPDKGARAICKTKGLEIQHTDSLFELAEKSFSVITMWHVLEHVYHLNRDLTQIIKLLKDDGFLIVAVPNCSSYDAKKYESYWAAYDLPIHLYHFRPNDIRALAKKHDLEIDRILPMKFDSYYVSMLSEQYKGGSKLSAFFSGLKSNRLAKTNGETYSSQIYVLKKGTSK